MHADARKLLWDAEQAAGRINRFTAGKTFTDYQADEYFRSAVERQFEIIGEALSQLQRIDPATAARMPELPRIVAFGGRRQSSWPARLEAAYDAILMSALVIFGAQGFEQRPNRATTRLPWKGWLQSCGCRTLPPRRIACEHQENAPWRNS
jgi:hypothetical protein